MMGAEPSKFRDLLDAWFPENGNPPSAFLIDTSEEALLLPDWLKLRMIRSSVMRLVDAGMRHFMPCIYAVSYTHLTLPTIYSV